MVSDLNQCIKFHKIISSGKQIIFSSLLTSNQNIDLELYGLFTVWGWSLYYVEINMINICESRNGMNPAAFVDDKFVTNIGRLM